MTSGKEHGYRVLSCAGCGPPPPSTSARHRSISERSRPQSCQRCERSPSAELSSSPSTKPSVARCSVSLRARVCGSEAAGTRSDRRSRHGSLTRSTTGGARPAQRAHCTGSTPPSGGAARHVHDRSHHRPGARVGAPGQCASQNPARLGWQPALCSRGRTSDRCDPRTDGYRGRHASAHPAAGCDARGKLDQLFGPDGRSGAATRVRRRGPLPRPPRRDIGRACRRERTTLATPSAPDARRSIGDGSAQAPAGCERGRSRGGVSRRRIVSEEKHDGF